MTNPGSDGLPYEKRADGKGEAECIEKEIPFELPEGWAWARLGGLCSLLRRGKSPIYCDSPVYPVFAQKCNQPWGITLDKVKFLDESALSKYGEGLKLRTGDVVVNSTGTGTLGRVGLFDESLLRDYPFIVPDSHVAVIRSLSDVDSAFVFHLLKSDYGQRLIFSKQTGSTNQKELPAKEVERFVVPVPPLTEQRRIVAALDKYLSLVDEIERNQSDLESLLAQLKSKVLDLAIRGELTERDPADEPASELLARIHEEKLAMVERGELKPKDVKGDTVVYAGSDGLRYEKPADGKGEAKCIEKEIPFELPEGWAWARMYSLCTLLRRGKSPTYCEDPVYPVFAQKCNQPWGITLEKVKFLDESALPKYGESLKLRTGDVLVNSTGTGTLGRVGLFDESLLGDYPFIVPDSHVAVIRSLSDIDSNFVFHLLKSEYGQRLIFSKQTGSTNQKELPAKEVGQFVIPIPPLAEQRRIVAAIESVFVVTNL